MDEEKIRPDQFDLTEVPTVAEYKEAFLACKSALRSKGGTSLPVEMLRANYYAPEHTLTAGDLADGVNLASYRAANLAYGKYAKVLCAHFGKTPKVLLAILVKFSGGKPGDEGVQLTLLPEVIQALEELSWVKPAEE